MDIRDTTHMIPFLDLKAQYESIQDEIQAAVTATLASTQYTLGRDVAAFEEEFAAYTGAAFGIAVNTGTSALHLALLAAGIGPGDEVITVSCTFVATVAAIQYTGATPVLVDVDPETLTMDIRQIEPAITERTKAILPVHLHGQPADMDPLMEISRRHGLLVIEDAAQAHGAEHGNKRCGAIGHLACFSFFPGKNLGAYGDAGAVVTNNDELSLKIRMYANHGRVEKYNHEFEGVNSRLDGLQAAVLDVKLEHLEEWTERRIAIAKKYDEGLKGIAFTPSVMQDVRHVYHLYVIQVKKRDRIRELLSEKGISTGIHYPIPLPFLKAYDYLGHKPADFPVSYALKDDILSLPIYGDMSDKQVEYVIDQLWNAVKGL